MKNAGAHSKAGDSLNNDSGQERTGPQAAHHCAVQTIPSSWPPGRRWLTLILAGVCGLQLPIVQHSHAMKVIDWEKGRNDRVNSEGP